MTYPKSRHYIFVPGVIGSSAHGHGWQLGTSELKNAVAVAEAGAAARCGIGARFDTSEAATRKLAAKYSKLTFCYEAGPTGLRTC
jgi:hypothetical protein